LHYLFFIARVLNQIGCSKVVFNHLVFQTLINQEFIHVNIKVLWVRLSHLSKFVKFCF
jgi:hypothetical protein